MSDEEWGLDTFIEQDNGDRFISAMEDVTGKERRLQLESPPIAYQHTIVSRDTAYIRTKIPGSVDSQYVAKFC